MTSNEFANRDNKITEFLGISQDCLYAQNPSLLSDLRKAADSSDWPTEVHSLGYSVNRKARLKDTFRIVPVITVKKDGGRLKGRMDVNSKVYGY